MRSRVVVILIVIAASVIGLLASHVLRTRINIGAANDRPRLAIEEIDHSRFDALLQKYVDDQGLVAYARWKDTAEDRQALEDYLLCLGAVDLSLESSQASRLAYWINAYNALTLKGILDVYPTSSIRNHTSFFGGHNVWRDLTLSIGGEPHSLDDIEHRILRKLGEPRIHFAIVCAARGCPPLRTRAYTANELDEQLSDNARRFFARRENFQTDPGNRIVFISELLSWYGEDFAATSSAQLRKLRPYFPQPDTLPWIEEDDVTVEYLSYDWALNDQQPARR